MAKRLVGEGMEVTGRELSGEMPSQAAARGWPVETRRRASRLGTVVGLAASWPEMSPHQRTYAAWSIAALSALWEG